MLLFNNSSCGHNMVLACTVLLVLSTTASITLTSAHHRIPSHAEIVFNENLVSAIENNDVGRVQDLINDVQTQFTMIDLNVLPELLIQFSTIANLSLSSRGCARPYLVQVLEAEQFNEPLFRRLLDRQGDIDINSINRRRRLGTPLHFACQFTNVKAIQMLLNHPLIQPNELDHNGYSPLHHLLLQSNNDLVGEALELMLRKEEVDVNQIGRDGTFLQMAVSNSRNLELVKRLFQDRAHDIEVNAATVNDQWTALNVAQHKLEQLMSMENQHGSSQQDTAMVIAQMEEIVQLLLVHGAVASISPDVHAVIPTERTQRLLFTSVEVREEEDQEDANDSFEAIFEAIFQASEHYHDSVFEGSNEDDHQAEESYSGDNEFTGIEERDEGLQEDIQLEEGIDALELIHAAATSNAPIPILPSPGHQELFEAARPDPDNTPLGNEDSEDSDIITERRILWEQMFAAAQERDHWLVYFSDKNQDMSSSSTAMLMSGLIESHMYPQALEDIEGASLFLAESSSSDNDRFHVYMNIQCLNASTAAISVRVHAHDIDPIHQRVRRLSVQVEAGVPNNEKPDDDGVVVATSGVDIYIPTTYEHHSMAESSVHQRCHTHIHISVGFDAAAADDSSGRPQLQLVLDTASVPALSSSRPYSHSDILRLPLQIHGLRAQDAGGVSAVLLESLSKHVLGYREQTLESLVMIDDEIALLEDTSDPDSRVFFPSPALLSESTTTAALSVAVQMKLRMVGLVLGLCLNTAKISDTLTAGVPIDRIVLKKMIHPSSIITKFESAKSSLCSRVKHFCESELVSTPEKARSYEYFDVAVWPSLREIDGISASWSEYCHVLTNTLLDQNNRIMSYLRSGFEITLPPVPVNAESHGLVYTTAHDLIVGSGVITFDALRERLRFPSSSSRISIETAELAEHAFLKALEGLDDAEKRGFLKAVTGSSRLRLGRYAATIEVEWMPPMTAFVSNTGDEEAAEDNGVANTASTLTDKDKQLGIIAHTCTSSIEVRAETTKEHMKLLLQGLLESGGSTAHAATAFNFA